VLGMALVTDGGRQTKHLTSDPLPHPLYSLLWSRNCRRHRVSSQPLPGS
jgi:hypothetical protein